MAEVASWALQRGVYQALAGSLDLTTLLGGVRVYDHAPQAAPYPFITLGQSVIRDWSTGTEDGAEHNLTLHVWSRSGGKKQVHEIIETIKDVLHDQPLTLSGSPPRQSSPRIVRGEARSGRRHLPRHRALSRGDRAGPGRRGLDSSSSQLSLPGLTGHPRLGKLIADGGLTGCPFAGMTILCCAI